VRGRGQIATAALLLALGLCAMEARGQSGAANHQPAATTASPAAHAASAAKAQEQTTSHASPPPSGALAPPLDTLPEAVLREPPPPPPVPFRVTVPAGTKIEVVLDTPVSTRISHDGQLIHFRTSDPVYVNGKMALASDSELSGKVTEVHKPGFFGSAGRVKMQVNGIDLPGGTQKEITATLAPTDPQATGKAPSEGTKAANILNTVLWTTQGTLIGAQVAGGKGAAIGAGGGAAIAMLILMSKHGQDVYLEPGTPFEVTLKQPTTFWTTVPGAGGAAAATSAASEASEGSNSEATASPYKSNGTQTGSVDPRNDPTRPKLRHRPKAPAQNPTPPQP
jgi:hypothetical protein